MHRTGEVKILLSFLLGLLLHRIGRSLHFVRGFLHLVSERFLLRFNIGRLLLMIVHLHLAMLHSGHVAVVHVLHALRIFRPADGSTELALDRDCYLVMHEHVVRRPHWNANFSISRVSQR